MTETSTFVIGYPLGGSAPAVAPLPVSAPTISVLDSAAERGDGIFETFGVIGGKAQATAPHLQRLAESAQRLELPAPDLALLADIVADLAARAPVDVESYLKLVLSRGFHGGLNGWAVLGPSADSSRLRAEGMPVITLPTGYASDFPASAPWLLFGAKTLSYATNMAATRAAHRAGAGDAVSVTSDGVLLEGPTSSLIARLGDELVTPDPALGILHGTTQRAVFAFGRSRALATRYGRIGVADLAGADGAWLVSSVRMAVPLTAIDGIPLAVDHEFTDAANADLLARAE